jgi:NitT/TauT family transport system permease protein
VETPNVQSPVVQASPVSEPVAPEIEIGALKMKPLLERVTRDQVVTTLLACVSIGGLFLFWYLGTKYKLEFYIRFKNVPAPYEVFRQAIEVVSSTKFLVNVVYSVRRILFGFAIAIAVGVPLGLMIGKYRRVRDLFMPVVEIMRPIPAIAWVPMAIMLWPTNEQSIVFITFLGSFFPILVNTLHGMSLVDPVLVRAARCLGAKEASIFREVYFPASLPHIFTGLTVGMGVAWVSLIAAEMISGQYGIGYFTWEAYSLVQYPDIALGMIAIGVLGLLSSLLIRSAGKLAMPWGRT